MSSVILLYLVSFWKANTSLRSVLDCVRFDKPHLRHLKNVNMIRNLMSRNFWSSNHFTIRLCSQRSTNAMLFKNVVNKFLMYSYKVSPHPSHLPTDYLVTPLSTTGENIFPRVVAAKDGYCTILAEVICYWLVPCSLHKRCEVACQL